MTNNTTTTRESTRDRIINVAESLFANNTYERTTLRQIATEVGIKEPSIYAHFTSKSTIYTAVIDRALEPFMEEIDSWSQLKNSSDPMESLPRRLMEMHRRHPHAAKILHKELCNAKQDIHPSALNWIHQIVEQSTAFGQQSPQNTPASKNCLMANALALTNATLGFFSSQPMQQQLMGVDYDSDTAFNTYAERITNMFRDAYTR